MSKDAFSILLSGGLKCAIMILNQISQRNHILRIEVSAMRDRENSALSEYVQMKEVLENAKLGAFLIVPLKYNQLGETSADWLEVNAEPVTIETVDLNDSVRKLLNSVDQDSILRRYLISGETVLRNILGEVPREKPEFYACDRDHVEFTERQRFTLLDEMELYIFHTKVAFLCVKICFDTMAVLDTIANLGYTENNVLYFRSMPDGSKEPVDFEGKLLQMCRKSGLSLFNDVNGSIFLEAYSYTTAVVSTRFRELETMRQATFNLHLMVDLPEAAEDGSEEDINYVYAVKDQSLGSYRWGSCITSQTISYIVARQDTDIVDEMALQAENGVPLVLLALYQKYTCLRYQEILAATENFTPKRIRMMRKKLLDFQVFGTIAPANISHWHNIKQTYKYLLEENDIPEAVEKMSLSLKILADRQKEIADARFNVVLGLAAVFGAVAVPSAVIGILEMLHGADPLSWLAVLVSLMSVIVVAVILMFYRRGHH